MATDETRLLREELEHYRAEKERIRQIVGQIGGQPSLRRTRLFNAAILTVVVTLFLLDLAREAFGLFAEVIPPFVLLEVAVFLLSLKIVWMIHLQMKLHHFQFWIKFAEMFLKFTDFHVFVSLLFNQLSCSVLYIVTSPNELLTRFGPLFGPNRVQQMVK